MRPQKPRTLTPDLVAEMERPLQAEQAFDFETFEIKTLEDFKVWNFYARKAHREARKFDKHAQPPYAIKIPDETYHEKVKVKFQRFDQPENLLKVWVHTAEIDWKGQLKPGGVYDLPKPVVKFLNTRAVPVYGEVKVDDGGDTKLETKQIGERARFSCQRVDDY